MKPIMTLVYGSALMLSAGSVLAADIEECKTDTHGNSVYTDGDRCYINRNLDCKIHPLSSLDCNDYNYGLCHITKSNRNIISTLCIVKDSSIPGYEMAKCVATWQFKKKGDMTHFTCTCVADECGGDAP